MSNRRLEMHRLQELVRLHRMGKGCREVARLLGVSPNTERLYREALVDAGLLVGDPRQVPELADLRAAVEAKRPVGEGGGQPSSLESWRGDVEKMMDGGAGPRAIYDNLRLKDPALVGKYSAMKRLCRRIRADRGVQPEDVAVPVETAPGDVAQIDFGYVGKIYDPEAGMMRKAWVFVMVLGYSRHMWADIVFDQKIATWLSLHVRAFEALGGAPKTWVPDNLKAAVIRAAFGVSGEVGLNRSYRELARHYGCTIDPTPPRSPEKKGKVESGVKYVKRNFVAPLDLLALDIDKVRAGLREWLLEVAGKRVHGTTRRVPAEVFEAEERHTLVVLPASRFEPVIWKQAKVHQDCHIVFEKRLYSAPWRLVGKNVWVRATQVSVEVYADDTRVATHRRRGEGYRSTNEAHLPEHRRDLRHRSRDYWEAKADAIDEEVGAYIREVFESDNELSQLRGVQAMVKLLEGYPVHRAKAASARARFYGSYRYSALKRILVEALDLVPLPTAVSPAHGVLAKPRFARTAAELLNQMELKIDECN